MIEIKEREFPFVPITLWHSSKWEAIEQLPSLMQDCLAFGVEVPGLLLTRCHSFGQWLYQYSLRERET